MNRTFDLDLQTPPGEASSLGYDIMQVLADDCTPALFTLDDKFSMHFPVETTFFVDQWEDSDEEEIDDDDDMDVDLEEEEDDEIWEEEEFDVDEEDFDLEEEDDLGFDPYDDEEDFFDDEPEAKGHRVEDRNPAPCNPSFAVEARMEVL